MFRSEWLDDYDQNFHHRKAGKKHDLMMNAGHAIYPLLGKRMFDVKPPRHFTSCRIMKRCELIFNRRAHPYSQLASNFGMLSKYKQSPYGHVVGDEIIEEFAPGGDRGMELLTRKRSIKPGDNKGHHESGMVRSRNRREISKKIEVPIYLVMPT
jgi:hypothetical protein